MEKNEVQLITTVAFSTLGFMTALSSLALSYLNYKRDQGRIDIYLGVSEVRDGTTLRIDATGIRFSVVNSGRRPLILTSIGGYPRFLFWKKLLKILTLGKYKWHAYFFSNPKLQSLLTDNGGHRLYQEGVRNDVFLPFPDAKKLANEICKMSEVHVFDSTGKRHRTNRKIMASFRKSWEHTSVGQNN